MEAIKEEFENYINSHTQAEPELLNELNRKTHQEVLQPRMLSGHYQGRLLSLLTHMIKPARILEIGTYTGYSAICMAEGLAEGGLIDTIEIDEELIERAQGFIEKAGYSNKIKVHCGNALNLLQQLKGPYDLVFIDADKENYVNYLHAAMDLLNPGGYLIADNVLWSGKVLDENQRQNDRDTGMIDRFNKEVQNNDRLQNILLPVRDGLMLARKIK